MRHWFKVYTEALDDPKILRLSDKEFRAFFNMLMIAAVVDNEGDIGTLEDLAIRLRVKPSKVEQLLSGIVQKGIRIIRQTNEIYRISAFSRRQPIAPSDNPESVAARVAKHRAAKKAAKEASNAVTGSLQEKSNGDVTTLEENRVEENRVDKKKLSGAAAPAASQLETKAPDPKPSIAASAPGQQLQTKLNTLYASMGRNPPTKYSNPQQKAAFDNCITALGAEFGQVTDKAFERGIIDLGRLLPWYQSCLKQQRNGAHHAAHQPASQSTNPNARKLGAQHAALDPGHKRVKPVGN